MSKRLIKFTDRHDEMIDEIIREKGYATATAVIHQALVTLHSKLIPNYIRNVKETETPEERVNRKNEEKKAKEKMVKQEYLDILEKLGGEYIEENGKEYAKYYTYNWSKRYEQKIPLTLLSTDLIQTQYSPDKAKVLELQKAGKVEY